MLNIFISFSTLLLAQVANNEGISRIITTIVEKGTKAIVECNNSCNFDSLLWSYKPSNEACYEDLIVVGSASIRNKISRRRDQWFNVTNDTNCRSSLFLPKIQFEAAGVYACWEGSVANGKTNVIVVNQNNCSITPEFPDYENILLRQNDSVTIKCSFQYSADESCIVTPIWTDLTGYRNLTIPDDDFEVNMDDKHAWIHLKDDVKIINGTQFNLCFAFKCSFVNISVKNQGGQRGRYDFGIVPFKLFIDGPTKIENNDHKTNAINFLLTVVIGLAIAIVIIIIIFIFMWQFYKLFYDDNTQTNNNVSVLGKALPGIPLVIEDVDVRKDFQCKNNVGSRFAEDVTYDIINDFM